MGCLTPRNVVGGQERGGGTAANNWRRLRLGACALDLAQVGQSLSLLALLLFSRQPRHLAPSLGLFLNLHDVYVASGSWDAHHRHPQSGECACVASGGSDLNASLVHSQRNLPNKRHIGKQDPYCTVRLNNETRRTKAVKRGGQHPEWDEEVRFTLFEDTEEQAAPAADGDKPPPPPPKKGTVPLNIKGGKSMRLACYADDPREPDLIGDVAVDLTEALTKGEVDGNALTVAVTTRHRP